MSTLCNGAVTSMTWAPDDLADLVGPSTTAPAPPIAPGQDDLPPLISGSVLAKAINSAWSGVPVTIVTAPAGGGSSRLAADLARWLSGPAGLSVGLVVRTEAEQFTNPAGGRVSVVTDLALIGARATVAIIDSAASRSFHDVDTGLPPGIAQVVLVGDPAQTGDPAPGMIPGPAQPDAIAGFMRAVAPEHLRVIRSTVSHRVGPEMAEALASAYPGGIIPCTPPVVTFADGSPRPPISALILDPGTEPDDMRVLGALAGAARAEVGGSIRASDVLVIVPRYSQAVRVRALLDDLADIAVITQDEAWGRQAPVVLALDPVAGAEPADSHLARRGRLVTLLTRHSHRLIWVTDPTTGTQIRQEDGDVETLPIREALLAAAHLIR